MSRFFLMSVTIAVLSVSFLALSGFAEVSQAEISIDPVESLLPKDEKVVFRASGTEPGWVLSFTDRTFAISAYYGDVTITAPLPEAQGMEDGSIYNIKTEPREGEEGHQMEIRIMHESCVDDSDTTFPNQVQVVLDGQTLEGCGGEME